MKHSDRILNICVASCLVLLALLPFPFIPQRTPAPAADIAPGSRCVIITVDGKECARVPLSQPQTLRVYQDNGSENIITISEDGAVMASANCENQLCVHMGKVTLDNWEFRPNGAFIICLPNRVSVELIADP